MNHTLLRRDAKIQLAGGWLMLAIGALVYLAIESLAGSLAILAFIISGPLTYGFIKFITRQVDYHQQDLNDIFLGLHRFVDTMVAGIVVSLLVTVGMVLLIVPGIIVACGLSQTFFIMADNPQISGTDAIKLSWEMMRGYKWDYFVFILGFFGWFILCILTFGILILYVEPYLTAAQLNYYRELNARKAIVPPTYHV